MPFSRVLSPSEMQTISSRIWACVADSISGDDKHYSKRTSSACLFVRMSACVCVGGGDVFMEMTFVDSSL